MVPVHERDFGFVFQDFALFPHKDVADNVAFGLRMRRWPPARRASRTAEVLALMGLEAFASRAVYDLSGGEQQRVALARALAPAPQLLLLDEPLGSLDRSLRERLMLDLRRILKQVTSDDQPMTALYVTHDQAEAFAIADRVLVMNRGRIEQSGTPRALYRRPRTPFVARFLGMENVLEVQAWQTGAAETALGPLQIRRIEAGATHVLIRPDGAILDDLSEPNRLTGLLTDISFRGRLQLATLAVQGREGQESVNLRFEVDSDLPLPEPGELVSFAVPREKVLTLGPPEQLAHGVVTPRE
jgi:ABC-type Fe3+/spermidine/putrescine transport system ATPase subunit